MHIKYLYSYINPKNETGIIGRYYSGNQEFYKSLYFPIMLIFNFTTFYLSIIYKNNRYLIHNNQVIQLYLVNFFSIIFLSYNAFFSSGSATISMAFLSFTLSIYTLIYLISYPSIKLLLKIILSLTCISLISICTLKIFYIKPIKGNINTGLIGHLIQLDTKIFDRFRHNILNFCTEKDGVTSTQKNYNLNVRETQFYTCRTEVRDDINKIIYKWFSGTDKIFIAHRNSVEILFENKKYHSCLPNPVNDELFSDIYDLSLNKCAHAMKTGDLIIVDKSLSLYEIELAVLTKISALFHLKEIDETKNFIVLQLNTKDKKQIEMAQFPLYFINKISEKDGVISDRIPNLKKDYKKGKTEALLHLNKHEDLEKVELWIGFFKKNSSSNNEENPYIESISLLSSEDGIRWKKLYYENNPKTPNNFYHRTINIFQGNVRYLKVNLIGENNIYIHRIYVFNKGSLFHDLSKTSNEPGE
jgi:hypothetical protein